MALAEPAPLTFADFEGRWSSKDEKTTLDIARCGTEWCGVIVSKGACGHTALRASERISTIPNVPPQDHRELAGQLQLAANTQPYGVRAVLGRNKDGAVALVIAGHSGGEYAPMRRMYDYRALLSRAGDAACQPSPKTS